MNYSHPANKYHLQKNINNDRQEYENIITQQIIISQLSNGITYKDTEEMDNYERTFIFKKLVQMKKEENDAKLKAIEEAKQKRQ